MRAPVSPLRYVFAGLLLVAVVVAALHVTDRFFPSTRGHDAAVAALAPTDAAVVQLESARDTAGAALAVRTETLTVTVTRFRTLVDTLLVAPTTAAETAQAIAQLPQLRDEARATIAACTAYQSACERYRQTSAALIDSLRASRDGWRTLALRRPPRLSAAVDVGYDPFAHTPVAGGDLLVHLRGRTSILGRGNLRFAPGEVPRAFVGIRYSF